MNTTIIIILLILSYLIGSIPGGYLLTKLVKKEDIRKYGSKSTGATNTTRVLGWKLGFLAALIDIVKGIVIIAILKIFELEQFYLINLFNREINIITLYGIFAVIGHIYPLYLNFKGGKAVATSFGVVTIMTPLVGLAGILLFIIIVKLTKYVSLTSMLTAFIMFLIVTTIYFIDSSILNLEIVITYLILVTIIVIRHLPNIKRLLKNEEPKASLKKQI